MFADNVNVLKLSKLGYFWSTCMCLQGIPEYLIGTKTLSVLLKKFFKYFIYDICLKLIDFHGL